LINLCINERREGAVTILDLKGRVRAGGATVDLHRSIRSLVREEKVLVLLNLAGVTFMDSCGLGELVASQVTLRNSGGGLKLLNVTPSLRELMAVTSLLEVFSVYADETEALASFAAHKLTVKTPQLFFV
jgi:anti-sigma B factor antagonist